jgi:ABC-type sugar transport system substrate-binding protein
VLITIITKEIKMKVNKLIKSFMASALIGLSSSVLAGDYPVYEGFNNEAKLGQAYSGLPGKGKKIAFSNIVNGSPFCDLVEESVIRQAMAAGFAKKDIIILNNQYDDVIGLKNADIILAQQPDVFIEFQFDERANNVISRKFAKAGIPIIAIDVPVPGSPFMGADNFGAAWLGGEVMAQKIIDKFGSFDAVDKIALLQFPTGGSATMMRSAGRWNPDDVVIIGMGAGPLGQEQLRDGQVDGSVAFYPEKYGQWAVPAAVARMMGEAVPPYMYPDHVTITMDNIDQYYPQ